METAKNINVETAATDDCTLSDEMIEQILEAEAYMEAHPDEWVTVDELKAELAKI